MPEETLQPSKVSKNGENKANKKRVAQSPERQLKMKKIKIDPAADAIYKQFVQNRYRIKKPKKGEAL